MPYNAFDSDDSDDLIVLEIPTDEEESDDDSDDSYQDYQALLGKRKRNIPVEQKKAAGNKLIKVEKVKAEDKSDHSSTPKKRGRPIGTKTKPPSCSKQPTTSRYIKKENIKDEEHETKVTNNLQTYTTMTDTEVNAIIQTDLSMGADLVTEDAIPDDSTAEEVVGDTGEVEEKVFTELPNKYLLYDELIATIIGFDGETPIVEFTSISREELKKCEKQLPMECGVCPSILSAASLSEHLKVHQDPETKRFNCIYCDNTACNRHSAASHSRRHLGIRPYACDICDNYFTTKNDLKLHYQRKHLEREFICEMCGKTYAQNTFLKRHIESHHQGKRPHQCNYCPKSYHRRGNLKEHVEAVHMGNRKPLSCRFCGIEFRDSHKLSRHRKEEHLNKSHFECAPCGVEFTDIQFFNAHKRSIQCKNNRIALKMEEATIEDTAVEVVLS